MGELLSYRGHAAADVPPVLFDRMGGRVRVVVRYPQAARERARNRFLIAVAVLLCFMAIIWRLALRFPRSIIVGLIGSLWLIGAAVVMYFATMWWRSSCDVYVFEADPDELRIELKGLIFGQRWKYPREWIADIRVRRDREGRAEAMDIVTTSLFLRHEFLHFLDERYIEEAVAALRDGMKLDEGGKK